MNEEDLCRPGICRWCEAVRRGEPEGIPPVRRPRRPFAPTLRQQYYADVAGRTVRRDLKPKPERLRKVAERDGWICQLCGHPVDPNERGPDRPSVDHILRQRDGGGWAQENLRLAHQSCNSLRG